MATLLEHRSEDVDDQAQSLAGWQQSYEQLGAGRFCGSAWQMVMTDGVLLRESTNRSLREHMVPPPGQYVLAVPLAVAPGSMFAGRPLERESLLLLSGSAEIDLVASGELDLIALTVDRRMLETLAPAKVEWLEAAARESNLTLAPETAAAIRHMLLAVAHEAEQHMDALEKRENEAALLNSTLTHALMLAMSGDRSERATSIPRRAHTRLQVVRRAVDFMRGHIDADIGVPEICAAACASRRTLQYCFEEFMHTTPQAYLRALRLNAARRALKARADQPITSVAGAFGFGSASQFTRHYKMMFDELPSETLKLHGFGTGGV